MPKVSIVIPTYNVESYLRECLDSVVNQTLKDIEIICVNDGSTDNSLQIIQEYAAKDYRIKVIDKPNSGYGHSMNVGIDNATGEYLGIVEPDDYVELNMYETLYNKAKELDLDFIKSDFCRFVGDSENRKFTYNRLDRTGNYYNKIVNIQDDLKPFYFIMNTWSGIYNLSFLRKYNIRHNETPGAAFQDNGFWFQTFMNSTKAYFLDQPFYMNRRDNPNSSVKNKAKVYCMCEEYDYIRNIIDKNSDFEKFIPVYQCMRYRNYIFTLNRIDNKFKKEFIKKFSKDFKLAMQNNEIDKSLFGDREYQNLELIINNPDKFYRKHLQKLSLFEKIFSVKNKGIHKIITILGVKIKFKNKKLIEKQKADEIKNILQGIKRGSCKNYESLNHCYNNLNNKCENLNNNCETIKKNIGAIINSNKEILTAQIFNNLILQKEWIKNKEFIPTKGAATYSFLYILLLILEKIQPKNILEFGLGQTTILTTQYAKYKNPDAILSVIDHDEAWINAMSEQIPTAENIKIIKRDLEQFSLNNTQNDKYYNLQEITSDKKFDFIIIDGPYGFDRLYPRTNILDLIPNNLAEDFVIILDDAERVGEQNTAKLIFEKLDENNIQYYKFYQRATKSQLVITSEKYKFISFY